MTAPWRSVTAIILAFAWLAMVCAAEIVRSDPGVERAIQVIAESAARQDAAAAAKQARDELVASGVEILPRLLSAMDTPNIVAANWYRTAFDAIADRELARDNPQLPRRELEAFVRDSQRSGRPRRLAFSLLQRLDPKIRAVLLTEWADDPEFRRDAVEELLRTGDLEKRDDRPAAARDLYLRAFQHARHSEQVLEAVDKLAMVGESVDPVAHLGFVNRWWIIGPFSAPGMSGFQRSFLPQEKIDLQTEVDGDDGQKVRWKLHQTTDRLGETNLNQALAPTKEAVGYAFAEIDAAAEQRVRLACSADDNLTVWINDELALAREQWLNGTRLDRFVVPVTLRAGKNRILVKVCQGPQHVNPEVPNNWTFQLRLCDESGRAAEFRNLLPLPP